MSRQPPTTAEERAEAIRTINSWQQSRNRYTNVTEARVRRVVLKMRRDRAAWIPDALNGRR